MPSQKDFKRRVRARMKKTGESYTTARAHLLEKKRTATSAPAAPRRVDYARLGGKTDAILTARTGHDWAWWVQRLDRAGAVSMAHGRIADLVGRTSDVSGWWAQMVAVGYERIRGLREVGQRRNGLFEVGKSKTVAASVSAAFRAFKDTRTRKRWLPEPVTIRTATKDKTIRLGWEDGTIVAVYFLAKGKAKTQVAVQHMNVRGKARSAELKVFWAERLASLSDHLATPTPPSAHPSRSSVHPSDVRIRPPSWPVVV